MNEAFVNDDINQAFWDNPTNEAELRDLMVSSFVDIIKYFNKMDYTRWINKRNLPDMIRNYIIDYYDRDAEKKKPGALGIYSDERKDVRIRKYSDKYRNRVFDMRHVARHETLHYIAHAGNTFHSFIDEGLTELFNKIIEADQASQNSEMKRNLMASKHDSYSESVSFASFLLSIFGKDLAKNFISGVSPEFYSRFYSSITPNGKEDIQKTGVFNTLLDDAFSQLYAPILNNQDVSAEEINKKREKFERSIPLLMTFIQNIIVNRVREESDDLEFIKSENGNLSLDLEKIEKYANASLSFLSSKSPLYKHFLSKLPADELEKRRVALKKALIGVITTKAMPLSDKTLSEEELKRQLFANYTDRIKEKEANRAHNVSKALLQICKVAGIIYPNENREKSLIEQYLKENLPSYITNDADFMNFITGQESINLFKLLSKKKEDAKANYASTSYIRVRENFYIEKKDDQASLFVVTKNGIENIPLIEGKDGSFSILDYNGHTYTIENLHRGLEEFRIYEGNNDITPRYKREFNGEEELCSNIISDFYMSRVYSKIAENAYIRLGNNSGNEARKNRIIDFEAIIQDLGYFNDIVSEDFSTKTLSSIYTQIIKDNFYFTQDALEEGRNASFERKRSLALLVDSTHRILNFPNEPDDYSVDIIQTANETLDDYRWKQIRYEQYKKMKDESKVTLRSVRDICNKIKARKDYVPRHGENT